MSAAACPSLPPGEPRPVSSSWDAVPGGVLSLTADLRIVSASRSVGELSGRDPAALVGELFDVLLSAPSRILFQTHVYPALSANGRVDEVFLTLAAVDGQPVPVLLNATRAAVPNDYAFDVLIVRIRARARWEADLLAATRALEGERAAAERLAAELATAAEALAARLAEAERSRAFRDAFIGVISHELRTPITTIFGMSHVLGEHLATMDQATIRQHLADIEAESDRLQRLTEDLLVLSRAEGGKLSVADDPIMLGHLVRAAVHSERTRASTHALTVDVMPETPLVLGDQGHVEQVVRNYLSNAAKYSPVGTTIRVVVHGEDGGAAVRVTDEGPGFGDQNPDQLFELFFRTREAIRQKAGAGLGLFICRELIGAMGGRVWATQPPSGGAEFGFWLPAADTDTDSG